MGRLESPFVRWDRILGMYRIQGSPNCTDVDYISISDPKYIFVPFNETRVQVVVQGPAAM